MTVGGRVGALWIGGLEPYMDEAFLQVAHHLIALFCSSCILLHMIILNLLAPTGALIVMMVYYIYTRGGSSSSHFFRFSLNPLMQLMLQVSV